MVGAQSFGLSCDRLPLLPQLRPTLSSSLLPREEWDTNVAFPRKGCEAASSWAVRRGALDAGLCREVTWRHQPWDLMGKPARVLEAR